MTLDRDEFIEDLKTAGIGTSVHFIPLHRHPYYVQEYGYKKSDFPTRKTVFRDAFPCRSSRHEWDRWSEWLRA